MLRADIWIYGARSHDEIYRGLISGYTGESAAFVHIAAVALAAKHARILWALLAREQEYRVAA